MWDNEGYQRCVINSCKQINLCASEFMYVQPKNYN
jgi:hypothetical protein